MHTVLVVGAKDGRARPSDLQRRAADVERASAAIDRFGSGMAKEFHAAMAMMYPPEWWATMARLQAGDADAVEAVILFLEADPRCFRSGYEKERICRFVGRCPLTTRQAGRLLDVIDRVRADTRRPGRERRAFERLAARLARARTSPTEPAR